MTFSKILDDIRSLKIQGAKAVALAGLDALSLVVRGGGSDPEALKSKLCDAKQELFMARPTEPCLRNAVSYVLAQEDTDHPLEFRDGVKHRIEEARSYLKEADARIAEAGSHKIRKNMVLYTHCHSSTVVRILLRGKEGGASFRVNNTETRPLYQGRITAKELSSHDIPVNHYVDAAAREAIRKADLMLIGCDAITTEGNIINKIGSHLFALWAHHFDVPIYACTHLWKFDAQTVFGYDEPMEDRCAAEVWDKCPRNVTIKNPAFEAVPSHLVSGIITDRGLFSPYDLANQFSETES